MNSLFLYPADGSDFDRETILNCFRNLSALSEFELKPDGFALCTGRFEFEGESNSVELQRSLQAVVLGREGRAALKLGFEIQETYPNPLNITDESCSVEFCVIDFESFLDFERRLMEALK